MPKLLKHVAYSYKKKSGEDVVHYKYMVVIPEEARKQVKWSEDQELDFEVREDIISLRPRKSASRKRAQKPATS